MSSQFGSVPRVRFAPSPTGYLHVGGARTALFNWLFARRHGGVFVLRIEDTDVERSSADMVTGILDGLRWLGLDWDEGPGVGGPHAPYFQTERLQPVPRGRAALVASGPGLLLISAARTRRRRRRGRGRRSYERTYDRDAALARADRRGAATRGRAGEPHAIRFRVPAGRDGVCRSGARPDRFDHAHIEDFVVLRSDGHPTYHLSVVVDDIDMAITHVVRGDDHISNTPKQVLLYEALGAPVPAFAHVPLILGPDKKRLSKRHGATSVMEYEQQGYLPEALVNFLALLGWSPGGDDELFTTRRAGRALLARGHQRRQRRVQPREARLVQPAAPGAAVRRRADRAAAAVARARRPVARRPRRGEARWFAEGAGAAAPRAQRLGEFVEGAQPFLVAPDSYDPEGAARHLAAPGLREHLEALAAPLPTARFDEAELEQTLRRWPTRAASRPAC